MTEVIKQLSLSIRHQHLIKNRINGSESPFLLAIDEQLALNGITGFFGHSGAGKSTLLKIIAGITTPTDGEISYNDELLYSSQENTNLASHRRDIVGVFQHDTLLPHLSVYDNLLYGRKRVKKRRKISSDTQPLNVGNVVQQAGIEHLLNRDISSLSGGERQRVAIVQAVLSEPRLLLLDEPVTALDRDSKWQILKLIKTLQRYTLTPIIFVSHNVDEHLFLSDHLWFFTKGQIVKKGPTQHVINDLSHSLPAESHSNDDAQSILTAQRSQTAWPTRTTGKNILAPQTAIVGTIARKTHSELAQSAGLVTIVLENGVELYAMQEQIESPLRNDKDLETSDRISAFILASDISLSTHAEHNSSIVNHIEAEVSDINAKEKHALVSCDVKGQVFFATISLFSLYKLDISVGQTIYLQFKAGAIKRLS
ncbi:MAG: ATP-binding cassette domain-containing protein [Thalassotalea sp.]|nr:ATP-binding cassette domain-containing protein [Thalassotalea sp.]